MRTPRANSSGEAVDAEALQPPVIEPAAPVESLESVLDAGQPGQALMDVTVDGCELPAGVAVPEVVAPAPQYGVEGVDDHLHRDAGVTPIRPLPHFGSDRADGAGGRPPVQVVATSPPPRLHQPVVKAQEVEAVPTVGEGDEPGLVGMQLQPEWCQDRRHPLMGLFGPLRVRHSTTRSSA